MSNRILFIFNGLVKNEGKVGISGGDIRLFEIIKNLDSSIKSDVYTTPNGCELLEKLNVPYSEKYELKENVDSGIISNLRLALRTLVTSPPGLKNYDGSVYSSCEHLYDVFPALKLKLFSGCKWYAVYHWVEDYPWREKRGDTPLLRRYLYWLNRWFSGALIKYFADEILGVSDQTVNKLHDIKNIKSSKLRSVYCGVSFDMIQSVKNKYSTEKESKYDAVYMKRLNHGKGIFDLLEIWKMVCDTSPEAKLAIIGDGSPEIVADIKKFIVDNKLSKNIDLLGVVYDFEEKFRLLNSSKLFILPTHEENWAIVIGEAMAVELPVIVYRLKEIEPIWKDNVTWINAGDTKAFADSIIEQLTSPDLRKAFSQKAVNFIRQYDWKLIAKNEFQDVSK